MLALPEMQQGITQAHSPDWAAPGALVHPGISSAQPASAQRNKLFLGHAQEAWMLPDSLCFPSGLMANALCLPGFRLTWVCDLPHCCPVLSLPAWAASLQVLWSKGWAVSASSLAQRLLYLFFEAFPFSVAQQLLTHPSLCWQLLPLSIPWQFLWLPVGRVVKISAEP